MGFLAKTIEMRRIVGADNLSVLHSWTDSSYAVHSDYKGHTGGVSSFGREVVHSKCTKQKINTKSSTESEIVAASDYIGHTVWIAGFMKEQGYALNKKLFFQDNSSAI